MTCFWGELLSCRRILYIMVSTGFMINAALKTILNITIVTMVRSENSTSTQYQFDWSETQKQDLLGVFFWGFAFTKIPSGRLAEMIGSRKVTGYSMVLASLLTLLTPFLSFWSYYILLVSRVVMGFLIGASWPAIMPLAARWIPPNEHSIFMACLGSTGLGVAMAFQICGVLIAAYGWQSVFYVFGGVSLLWSMIWFYLIYDSPEIHPRISIQERLALEKLLQKKTKTRKMRFKDVPWIQLAKSGPIWAIVAGQVATFFGYSTLCNELPSYIDQVLHMDIQQTGAFSGLPYWGGYLAALISGYAADELRKSRKLSLTNIRKLMETTSLTIPCICMVTLGLFGDHSVIALTAFTVSLTTNAISSSGHSANILDISRNYSGTICGIVNTVSAFSAYFSTKLVAELLKTGHSFNEWRYLFWFVFAVYAIADIVYLVFCSAEIQPWDSLKQRKVVNKELQALDAAENGV